MITFQSAFIHVIVLLLVVTLVILISILLIFALILKRVYDFIGTIQTKFELISDKISEITEEVEKKRAEFTEQAHGVLKFLPIILTVLGAIIPFLFKLLTKSHRKG